MATSTRQAPRIAERGLPGESRRVRLELRLLAEAGLVGLPNAGKSSLLRAVSEARPKVGAYPFTTLEPYLGVAEVGYETLVVADIPGLIEGAHEGAGLGIGFLQHVRRTQVLIHVVDVTEPDPLAAIDVLRGELSAYGHGLDHKPWVAAPNKIDLPGARERADELRRALGQRGIEAFAVSALTGEGVERLMGAVLDMVRAAREEAARERAEAMPPRVEVPPKTYEVVRTKAGFSVRGERPERAAAMLGADSEEACAELVRRLQRMGVLSALRRKGAREGDRVRIDGVELEWPL